MPSTYDGKNNFFLNEFDESVDELMLPLATLVRKGAYNTIRFYINSEGGDSTRALSIVSLINVAKAQGITVETVVLNQAYSSGSLVAVAGTPGHRLVAPTASYMIHYGQTDAVASGPVEMQRIAQANLRHFKTISNQYLQNTNIMNAVLNEALNADNFYFTPAQAIDMGFADRLLYSDIVGFE